MVCQLDVICHKDIPYDVIFACPYLPQRCVQLMDDHFHLMTASKSYNSIVASKSTRLREVGHWVGINNIWSQHKPSR